MSATLRVHGIPEPILERSDLGRALPPGTVRPKAAVRVQAARAGATPVPLEGLAPDDVVEIELQDGLRIWSRVDDLQHDLTRRAERGVAGGIIDVPSTIQIGPASRANRGWAVKALKVFGIDIEEEITSFCAAHVEGRLDPGPGLYRCTADSAARLEPARSLTGSGPILVFLHGTASSTTGSFAGLWAPENGSLAGALFRSYGDRVLAYQHRTLSESPIENALALVADLEALAGRGAELHLVTHSRGGLVGELLARGMRAGAAPFTPDDVELFGDPGRERDRAAIEALSASLLRSGLRVTRFVRVACPARGTTLADRRLDRYVSVLVNLGSLIPAFTANPVYDGLTSLLAGVLKKRADPEALPGVEAMMPTSPLVRMLNNPDVATAADLHVLGGDLAGAGIFGRLKTLATDFYYRDDHDVVVNTPSMFGGTGRTGPIRYWIDTGDRVTHFHYFTRGDTARRLVAALTGSSADFRTLEAAPSIVTSADYVKRAAFSRPVVFVLPGIMGSQLALDDRPIWMDVLALAKGGLGALSLTGGGVVTATGLLADGYAALCAHLSATHDVLPFPYDWRQSIAVAADALRRRLDEVLPLAEEADQPVRLLAHSMGGLVVRAMLLTDQGRSTWARMCTHPGARVVMLGTPNRGSFAIPALLMGRDPLVKKLALVDLRSSHAGLLGTIAGFEGVLDLLPHDGDRDYFDASAWRELLGADAPGARGLFGSGVESSKSAGFRWSIPDEGALARSRRLAQALAASRLDPARVVYVAGTAEETPSRVAIDPAAPPGRRVKVLATRRGDGRVPWDTGIPPEVPVFYMDTIHGDMANDARHFGAIVDLLQTGRTGRLPSSAPVSRGADDVVEILEPMPAMIPDEAELVAAALGGSRRRIARAPDEGRIRIRLLHDNLTNARHPVLVSHYAQDVIVAAEKYLDERLDGRLSELLRLEMYPGPINTAVVVLNEPVADDLSVHPGAIVAGLGMVGELTPGALTSTLAHALTAYGAECVGLERRRRQRAAEPATDGPVSAPVTAILVGSGEGGVSLADSVRALLRAVLQANQRLRRAAAPGGSPSIVAQIDRVDVIELFEDRAIEAMYTLRALTASPEFDRYALEPLLVAGKEGLRRARFGQPAGWWQRVRITSAPDGELRFEAITQTARAAASLRPTQRGLVDGFVRQALTTTSQDRRLGQTLFELLVPQDFKSYAPDRQKLALVLNADAAALPWELMQDGFDPQSEPLSVEGGMIRQLLVDRSRAQVLRATDDTALIVGNPIVADERFPPLPGAREEADAVAALLEGRGGYHVVRLIDGDATPVAVLTAVHERPWRVLHLAAHGVFDYAAKDGVPPVSGLVLDDGLFFTAAEAEQLRYVPELVFINCCHLGQTRGDIAPAVAFHRLAANLATQFIRMGARGVVAAGWEVADAAAKTFALSFYQAMLGGSYFGDAVLQARRDTYDLHGETNTWGAYQCYGDPSFALRAGSAARPADTMVSEAELALWLEAVVKRAREARAGEPLRAELEAREREVPSAWWESAGICARAAEAFAAVGAFEKAIDYYRRVVSAEDADAPLAALEGLANCRVRRAAELAAAAPPRLDAAHAELDEADRLLRHLLAIGETAERWSLLGGVMKRRAQVAADAEPRRHALAAMSDAYGRAFEISRRGGGAGDPYPLANRIAADLVLSWSGGADRQAIAELLARLDAAAQARAGTRTDAFSLVARAERMLLAALLSGDLDEAACRRVEEAFVQGLSRGASAQHRDSVRSQFRFFRTMMATELPDAQREGVMARLTALEQHAAG